MAGNTIHRENACSVGGTEVTTRTMRRQYCAWLKIYALELECWPSCTTPATYGTRGGVPNAEYCTDLQNLMADEVVRDIPDYPALEFHRSRTWVPSLTVKLADDENKPYSLNKHSAGVLKWPL